MTAALKPTSQPEPTPFQLSRIYAKGWVAGSRSDLDPDDTKAIAALNPHDTEIERAKWQQGFHEAMTRRIPR